MAHTHIMYDSDPHFTIDPDTRVLTYTSPEKLTIMQNDHNSEIITFDIPREIDGHDMLNCKDSVQVHFVNIDANNTTNRVSGLYNVTDLQVSPNDNTKLVCSWVVSSEATSLVGTLHFVLRFACMSGSTVEYAWHTALYTGITILQTIDNTEIVTKEYNDVLEEWYQELMSAGNSGVNLVEAAAQEAIERIALSGGVIVSDTEPTSETVKLWIKPQSGDGCSLWVRNVTTGIFEPIVTVAGDAGEPIHIVQETGGSQTNVMSQKAVTDGLYEIELLRTSLYDLTIPSLESRLDSTEFNADEALNKVDELISDVDVVKSNNSAINGRIDFVEKDLEDLDAQVKTASNNASSVINDVSALKTKANSLESNMDDLQTGMSELTPFSDMIRFYLETLIHLRNDIYNFSDLGNRKHGSLNFSYHAASDSFTLFSMPAMSYETLVIPNKYSDSEHGEKAVSTIFAEVSNNDYVKTIIVPSSIVKIAPDYLNNSSTIDTHPFEGMPNLTRLDFLACSVLPTLGESDKSCPLLAKDSPNCKIYITKEAKKSSWTSSGWNRLPSDVREKIIEV